VSPYSPDWWARVEPLLDRALATPPEARDALLREAARDDAAPAAEVARLLAEAAALGDSPLDRPAALRFGALLDEPDDDARPARARAALEAALVGRYAIVRELGRGGMGVVYLARDLRHGREVALKVLRPDLAADVGVERFLAEIRVTAGLRHPNVLPLFDSGAAGDVLYYVVPYVEGGTLRDRLVRDGSLPLGDALAAARDVAAALAHAHARGVVHRDVKPENVLLDDGRAVLGDFGIAKALAGFAEAPATAARVPRTLPGVGTPAYMAPEQAEGTGPVDHRADLYALGAVTWELLTGEAPARAAPPATGGATPTSRALVLAQRRPEVPSALAALVARLLARDPGERPRDAAEVLRALEALVTTRAWRRTTRAARWLRRGVTAAGLLALAAVVGRGGGARGATTPNPAPGPGRRTASARALLDEADRVLRTGNFGSARRLYDLAVRTDSLDPVVWLRLAQASYERGDHAAVEQARRAIALGARAGDRDGARAAALARAQLAATLGIPSVDSIMLATGAALRAYPEDVDAVRYDGLARMGQGDFAGGARALRRALALDSAAVARGAAPRDAPLREMLVYNAILADSLAEAERDARAWVAREPRSRRAQTMLASALAAAERYDEARAVLGAAAAGSDGADPAFGMWGLQPTFEIARITLAARRFAEADAILDGIVRVAPQGLQWSARALRVASLRAQRRRAEALADARALRRDVIAAGRHPTEFAQIEAQALLDAGRPRAAAALFDSLATLNPPPHDSIPALAVRARVWWGTQAAGALLDAGDTTEIVRRIEAVAADGRESSYGRDQRLHHYLRGRLWAARGDHARAVAAYERAVFAPAHGYTRQNLMLARSLVALGRHDEALAWLRRAARGDVRVHGTFLTRTDVDSAMADVFERTGRRDSARVYRDRVARAERRPRREAASSGRRSRNGGG
jgi:predicted Zn-dependent protease